MMSYNCKCRLFNGTNLLRLFKCCITAGIFFIGCTSGGGLTGTGSLSGNGRISCVIHNDDGSFASNAAVRLRLENYTAGSIAAKTASSYRDTFTNEKGEFNINSIDSGIYYIEVNNGKSRAVLLDCEISGRDTMVHLPDATLLPTGSIKGSCIMAPGDSSEVYISVYGIERLGVRDEVTGEFIIGDVPAGKYTVRIMSSSTEYTPVQFANVNISPAQTADVGNVDLNLLSKWRFSKNIYLNTTQTGASVSSSVTDIPILVRLRADNFDFSEANAGGSDIRFTKADGRPLSFEIDKWDALASDAQIWVKTDTVYGNDSAQYFKMYWGNLSAPDSSKGLNVFDTANGFEGVWHLGENAQTVNDATANNNDGYKKDNVKTTAGNCGFSQFFDGSGDFVEIGNVCNPEMSNLTVCAWVKKAGVNKIQTIISKSAGGKATAEYGWLFQIDQNGALGFYMATSEVTWGEEGTFVLTSNVWITDTVWHHVAAVINRNDRNDCHVYIDGSDVGTYPTAGDVRNIGKLENTLALRIGSDAAGNCQWNGSIDEVTIVSRILSGDCIKLMYMNQSADKKLLSNAK